MSLPAPPPWDLEVIEAAIEQNRSADYRPASTWHAGLCHRCLHTVHGARCAVTLHRHGTPCLCPSPTMEELNHDPRRTQPHP